MSLVAPQLPSSNNSPLPSSFEINRTSFDNHTAEAVLSTLLGDFVKIQRRSSMDRVATEYSQTGLPTPYPSAFTESQSEDSPADHATAAQTFHPQHREARNSNFSNSATPTSEYGIYPTSARSSNFPEPQRQFQPGSNHSVSSGGMAQPTSPSSMPLQDGHPTHHNAQMKSDQDVPIDPSIAASSPTYPGQHGGQYSPYPPQQEMQHGYPGHPTGSMYQQPRPDWAGYAGQQQQQHGMPPYSGVHTPTSAASAGPRQGPPHHHLSQVYSFVPIPGAAQHKRPRRRYEEIERMYKCGWQGCEKAYGTLNHLNAHVTMQAHGQKRTPEEFKEIRKEWKQRKKDEETSRKADDDRARGQMGEGSGQEAASGYQNGRPVQLPLPPIGYQPGAPQAPGPYQGPPPAVQQLQTYEGGNGHIHYSGYPASPYGGPNMYVNRPERHQSRSRSPPSNGRPSAYRRERSRSPQPMRFR